MAKHQITRTEVRRFFKQLEETELGCMEFQGALSKDGYGQKKIKTTVVKAHRLALAIYLQMRDVSELGTDEADHLCLNRKCCNALHLQQVSKTENLKRMHEHRALSKSE